MGPKSGRNPFPNKSQFESSFFFIVLPLMIFILRKSPNNTTPVTRLDDLICMSLITYIMVWVLIKFDISKCKCTVDI